MTAREYLSHFFPFNKPDIYKNKTTARWNIRADQANDRTVAALAAAFANEPMAMNMSLQRIYAERFDWLATQFRDWAFMLVSSFLFYEDKDTIADSTRDLYRQGMSAFGGKAPTYHVSLYNDKPQIVWDFHSLLLTIQTLFGFALTDEKRPLRICKHCNRAFIAGHVNAEFCSPKCKNQYNVYKSREKRNRIPMNSILSYGIKLFVNQFREDDFFRYAALPSLLCDFVHLPKVWIELLGQQECGICYATMFLEKPLPKQPISAKRLYRFGRRFA